MRPHVNGRRGAFLLLFSLTYLMIGLSYVTNPETDFRAASFSWLTEFVPLNYLATIWLVSAGVGIHAAFRPRPNDKHGFQALAAVPAAWGTLFFVGGLAGVPESWVYAGIYYMFAGIPMVVSGMQGGADRDRRRWRGAR